MAQLFEQTPAVQSVVLTSSSTLNWLIFIWEALYAVIELDFTQFQNVRVVSFFVDDNQGGGDVTNVSKIVVNGTPVHTTNMSELKKC